MMNYSDILATIDLYGIHDRKPCAMNCCVKELLSQLFENEWSPELFYDYILEHEKECWDKFGDDMYKCHVRQISIESFRQMMTFLEVTLE